MFVPLVCRAYCHPGVKGETDARSRVFKTPRWDEMRSGGLFNNKAGARNPLVVADNPVDRWNPFHIIQRNGNMTTVWLNGQLVVDNVKMENYWDYSKPLRQRVASNSSTTGTSCIGKISTSKS